MKHFTHLGLVFVLPLVLSSCVKERNDLGVYPSITLTAESLETRTCLGAPGDGKIPVLWCASDEIWVRSASQEAATPGNRFTTSKSAISSEGKVADFTGQAPENGPYVAVYPYALVNAASDNETVVLDVPQNQTWLQDSFGDGANVAVAAWASGKQMQFKNLAGALKLSFTGSKSIKRIEIADNDPASVLWGTCTVSVDPAQSSVSSVVWTNEAAGRNRLILDCGDGVTLGQDAVSFHLVVPEGAFASGFTCTLYNTLDEEVKTIITERSAKVKRNEIIRMAVIAPEELPFSGGSGTAEYPYLIGTPADLVQLAALCNGSEAESYNACCYKQINDIDMDGVSIACIGNVSDKAFKGSYDGQCHTISNLSPTPADSGAAGMFAYTSGASVKDLVIDGYTNNGTKGEQGVIAGHPVNTTFSGIKVDATVDFVKCACGGIVGYMEGGSITDCHVSGFLHNEDSDSFKGVSGVTCQGGIAGYVNKTAISECTFSGNVTGNAEQLGGIVGQMEGGSVSDCWVLEGSTITGDNYYVGGIAGEIIGSGSITRCEVQAHVISWYPGAAGIVGWVQSGDISDCVVGSHALVRSGQMQAAGIVAYIYHKNTAQTVNISNCTVYCDVAAAYTVGGIVGECYLTSDDSKVNIWNCAYVGGEIINAGYATSGWTMVGGLVAWARLGNTAAELNIVNCFSDPSAIRCDFPQGEEADMGGFIGEQAGTVSIMGCYNTLAYGTAIINGKEDITAPYKNYGALIGYVRKTNFDHVYYVDSSLPALGTSNSGSSVDCTALSVAQMTGGDMLARLNAFKDSYSGPLQLKSWVGGENCYPVLEGMQPNPSTGKKKALRVSLIGDSLSTFDGYAPHCYQSSRAANGYRCHYPTSDGNVTSASQTYWYILTYELLSNAVWDTNLAFSGTATTRCTDASKSSQYWYGQDFCARYIENGGMGSPDIIIINGGANDWAHNCYNILGDQKLVRYPASTPHRPDDAAMNAAYAVADAAKTLDQAKALPDATFIEAYLKLIRMMTLQYPHVKIIVLIHDTLTPDVEESLLHIADHYDNCRAVDLYAVNGFNDLGWNFEYLDLGYQPNMPKHDFNWNDIKTDDKRKNCSDHYSAKAMRFIANKIYDELGTWLESSATYNEGDSGSISDFDNLNGAW